MDGSVDRLSAVSTTERVTPADRSNKDKKKNGFSDLLKEKMKEKLKKDHEQDLLLIHDEDVKEEKTDEESEEENKQEEQQDLLILHEEEVKEDKQIEQHDESKEKEKKSEDETFEENSFIAHVDFKA